MTDEHHTGGGAPGGVTVIVVTYRHERFVDELLGSLSAQTIPPQRVIPCDDASPDGSAARLREWAAATPLDTVLQLNEENRGLTATLNATRAHVETPYYAHISGDDLMRADRLERQLPVLDTDPALVFASSTATTCGCAWWTDSCAPPRGPTPWSPPPAPRPPCGCSRGPGHRAGDRPAEHWCARRDSNPHARGHQDLNLARLPVPPLARRARVGGAADPQCSNSRNTGSRARNALPRCEIAFFSTSVYSARVRLSPSGTNTGS